MIKRKAFEIQYATMLESVLVNGIDTSDRTGTGRRRLPNVRFTIDLTDSNFEPKDTFLLPVLNGKKVYPLMGVKEMNWMLSGDTNIKALEENHVTYWREWADENGDLGPVYGKQFRDMNGADQLAYISDKLVNDPMSTQMLINLWNAGDLKDMALPPCHFSYFFQALPDKVYQDTLILNLHLVQRSADAFLGVPYNAIMASYFLQLMSKAFGFNVGYVYWTCHDFHIYHNHFEAVDKYLFNVSENKFNTVGEFTRLVLDKPSMLILDDKLPDTVNPVFKLDQFFNYCFGHHFSNMKVVLPGFVYDPIPADIAV